MYNYKFHQEQLDTALEITNYKRSKMNNNIQGICVAPTQSGKTELQGALIEQYLKIHGNNLKVVLSGTNRIALTNQLFADMQNFGYAGLIATWNTAGHVPHYISWSGEKRNSRVINLITEWRKQDKFILFLDDESDSGSGGKKDDSEEVAIFMPSKKRDLCEKNKIPLYGNKSPRTDKEFGMHITATLGHIFLPYRSTYTKPRSEGDPLYRIFALKPGKDYKGIEYLYNKNYLYDSFKLTKSKNPKNDTYSDFFELIDNDISIGLDKNDPTYLILRLTATQQSYLEDHLIEKYSYKQPNCPIDVKCFESKYGNISYLPGSLQIKPKKPTIVLIKQSLTRGIQLKIVDHISFIWEYISHEAGVLQALVGRLTGYKKNYNKRLKIFTRKNWVLNNLKFYQTIPMGSQALHNLIVDSDIDQTSTHNRYNSGRTNVWGRVQDYDFSNIEKAREWEENFQTKHESFWKVSTSGKTKIPSKLSKTTCSKQNENSVADALNLKPKTKPKAKLQNARFHARFNNAIFNPKYNNMKQGICNSNMIPQVTCAFQLLYLDKHNENFKESWDSLPNKYKTGNACVITKSILIHVSAYKNNAEWKY